VNAGPERYKSYLAYIDVLGVFLTAFIFFFIQSLINQKTAEAKAGMEMKAEFVVEATWPNKAFDDIDMHMLLPNGKRVFYSGKDKGFAVLERDDLGALGDVLDMPDGSKKLIEINKEIITVRAIVPGRYVVNLYVYRARDEEKGLHPEVKLPYEAEVSLTKINPRIEERVRSKVTLTEQGQQVTAFSFTVMPNGEITEIDTHEQVPFIQAASSSEGVEEPAPVPLAPAPAAPSDRGAKR
jgi:hypothetical protein